MKRLLIFDWDDTLTLGAREAYVVCYHAALADLEVELSWQSACEGVWERWGAPAIDVLAGLLERAGSDVAPAVAEDAYDRHLLGGTFAGAIRSLPGAVDTVRSLAADYRLAVATGCHPRVLTEQVMPGVGMPALFERVISVYDLPRPELAKPHPYMVAQLLDELSVDPADALVIGDAPGDIRMAHAAGVEAVAVLTGLLTPDEAARSGAVAVLPDVTGLRGYLEG